MKILCCSFENKLGWRVAVGACCSCLTNCASVSQFLLLCILGRIIFYWLVVRYCTGCLALGERKPSIGKKKSGKLLFLEPTGLGVIPNFGPNKFVITPPCRFYKFDAYPSAHNFDFSLVYKNLKKNIIINSQKCFFISVSD